MRQASARAGRRACAPLGVGACGAHGVRMQRRNGPSRVRAAPGEDEDFGETVKKMAQKVQSALPVIGLLSKLAAPEGGVGTDELAYTEFCRSIYESADEDFAMACYDLELETGKASTRKHILFVLWTLKFGCGVVPNKTIALAATRLGVMDDLELEVDRFEFELGEALKKFEFEKRPSPPAEELLPIGVDALSRLLGRVEDASLGEKTEKLLARILRGIFPEASLPDIEQVFKQRPSRAGLYI